MSRCFFQACLILSLFINIRALTAQENESLQAAANKAAQTQIINVLVNDLNELIPGDYLDNSEQKKILVDIANAYVARDQPAVERLLGELANADENAPPQELLLAGMAFATNNAGSGSILLERGAILHKNHPGFALAFARLALLQNRYFDSVALTEKAMASNRASGLSQALQRHYQIASISLMTIIEIRRNELTAAEQFAKQWEQLEPNEDKMLLASAEVLFKQGKLDSAVEYLNRRSAEKLNEIPTEVVIGKWFQVKGDTANQSKWIADAQSKYPNNKLSQIEFAAILLRKEDFKQAVQLVEKYEQTFGETADSRLIKGRIAFSKQDYASAAKIFEQLFKQQPNNFENAYLHILSILENSDAEARKQAIALAQRVYQLYPNNQLSTAALAWTLIKTGSLDAGSELLQKTFSQSNLMPDVAFFLATLLNMQDRNEQAARILESIIDSPEIFLYRSRAKSLLNTIKNLNSLPKPDSDNQ